MRQTREPMHRINLVDQPLVGNPRAIRPEQAELQVLPRVELILDPTHTVPLPVRILLFQQRHHIRPPPASRLVYIPAHLHHHDVAKLPALDVLRSLHVARSAAPLRTHLHNLAALMHRRPEVPRIVHKVGGRLLDIRVPTSLYSLNPMPSMLEVRGSDNHRVHILTRIQLVVIPTQLDLAAALLLDYRRATFPCNLPDIRHRNQLEVHVLLVLDERRNIAAQHAIARAYHAHAHAIVRAQNSGVALGRPAHCRRGQSRATHLQKLPPSDILQSHR